MTCNFYLPLQKNQKAINKICIFFSQLANIKLLRIYEIMGNDTRRALENDFQSHEYKTLSKGGETNFNFSVPYLLKKPLILINSSPKSSLNLKILKKEIYCVIYTLRLNIRVHEKKGKKIFTFLCDTLYWLTNDYEPVQTVFRLCC